MVSKAGKNTPIPLIIGAGGINPAGRVSGHHAYRRLVIDSLSRKKQERTYLSLAKLMNREKTESINESDRQYILNHTLIRKIEAFDTSKVLWQTPLSFLASDSEQNEFNLNKKNIPDSLRSRLNIPNSESDVLRVKTQEQIDVLLPEYRESKVTSAGQLPSGFDPGSLYASRSHPRALQMTIYAASDAIRSTGFSIDQLRNMVPPDQIAVYSGSAMGQLDEESYGGLLQNALIGKRPSSKHCALGLPEMAGDFVNAYVLGSVGETAGIIGACATFLYNVKRGMDDIRTGNKRIVVVGNSEAPVQPQVIEGYRVMGALADDESLKTLDNSDVCDNRRACRPFSSNSGFTVAEASVWIVLMDDELALEVGARNLGAVGDVFVNADGYKKSIPGPGIGNYITMANALSTAKAILGEHILKTGTYMQAHGTGTPQNRVTESHILSSLAQEFGIENWLIGAVKCYLGHSMAPAGADQLSAILGAWADGIVPGITTIDHIASDVHQKGLNISMKHTEIDMTACRSAFVNSKGFGGNNATGLFLSPIQTEEMLSRRWGKNKVAEFLRKREATEARFAEYDETADEKGTKPIYMFGEGVIDPEDLIISGEEIKLPGFAKPIKLNKNNPYEDN